MLDFMLPYLFFTNVQKQLHKNHICKLCNLSANSEESQYLKSDDQSHSMKHTEMKNILLFYYHIIQYLFVHMISHRILSDHQRMHLLQGHDVVPKPALPRNAMSTRNVFNSILWTQHYT